VTPSSDPALFRRTMALLATGVTVITVRDVVTGESRGMTANAVMSVSLAPPLIVVSVRRDARLHEALRLAGAYGVTILGESQEREARRFASLRMADHEPAPEFTERNGVPVLRHGLAWTVARVVDAHPAGDHTLFVGEIVALAEDRPDDPPLAFHRSAFVRLITVDGRAPVPLHAWETGLDMWG
jgi:flavin reductase (DIM6/NTAB) family NADH-FMN oxidoreductase RutF